MTSDVTVPLLELKSQYLSIKDEVDDAIRGVVDIDKQLFHQFVGGLFPFGIFQCFDVECATEIGDSEFFQQSGNTFANVAFANRTQVSTILLVDRELMVAVACFQ